MEKVRIGNDLRVNFSVYRNGEQESFDGASNIVTKLVNEAYNKLITHTYTITGNIVQFDIDALQLTQCGKCRLFISYTKGGDYTVDSPAFELVNYTDQTGGTEIMFQFKHCTIIRRRFISTTCSFTFVSIQALYDYKGQATN